MRDLVIVTTYRRPEYLYVCLEALLAAGAADKEIWVVQDNHVGDRNSEQVDLDMSFVVGVFAPKFLFFKWVRRRPHTYVGNSYSVLDAYSVALRSKFRFIYLVEDDIFVNDDFFKWHEAVQAAGDYFCTVARIACKQFNPSEADAGAYYVSNSLYSSLGVCWRRENLSKVARHANVNFYKDALGYVKSNFSPSLLGPAFTEQDGLIRRVIMSSEEKLLVAFPAIRRANHIGVTGYHRSRGIPFTGSIGQKIDTLKGSLQDGSLKLLSKDHLDLDDIDTVEPTVPWEPENLYEAGVVNV